MSAARKAGQETISVLTGFKDFILRGNVVDLSVAVVIGAAFTGIVTAITTNVVNPLVNVVGGASVGGLRFVLDGSTPEQAAATAVDLGAVITAALNFVIVAAVVYFAIVLPVSRLLALRRSGAVAEPAAPSEDILLLQEIRDLLKAQAGAAPAAGPAAVATTADGTTPDGTAAPAAGTHGRHAG